MFGNASGNWGLRNDEAVLIFPEISRSLRRKNAPRNANSLELSMAIG
jgi:hypothetical protein